jgi:hypothetical protein
VTILVCSIASVAILLGNLSNSSVIENAEQDHAKSMEDLATQYASTNSSLKEVFQKIDNQTQSEQLTAEDANWLKARITEMTSAATPQPQPDQPETFEDFTNYFANYDSQVLNDIKTAQELYEQYLRNPGPNAPITQSMLQVLNQSKLKETNNLMFIDAEINQLIINGTLTNAQGTSLREHVHELRTP